MACKPNEVAILKATAVELDPKTVMILTYMYHTVSKEDKKNGAKSFYRYEGRVVAKDILEKEIDGFKTDANKLNPWKWHTKAADWNQDWFISYDGDGTNGRAAKWYKSKLNKILTWDNFLKLANEGIKQTAKGPKVTESAKYELDDYVTEDGLQFSITSPEEMLKHVGKCFTKKVILKRDLPK